LSAFSPSFTASENNSVTTPLAKAAGSIGVFPFAWAMQRYEQAQGATVSQVFVPSLHDYRTIPTSFARLS
jgi:hypothetical protein